MTKRTASSDDNHRLGRIGLVVLVGAVAAGCSGETRRSLGLERTPPDAFQVVTRAPLEIPPDFGLRPPQPGAARPNEATTRQVAATTVFGGAAPTIDAAGRTDGEVALLKQTGALQADPSIRQTVDRESLLVAQEDRSLVDSLIFWRDKPPPGTVVDAQAEAQRLQQNAALGKPPAEGETPIIRRKSRGILDGIF